MGLDTVEFIMAVEHTFDIDIPNADAERLRSPGDVVTYLATRVSLDRETIEASVRRLVKEELGVKEFMWTDSFTKLGAD